MTRDARIALAGFLATAVAFGPARMGYGLFMPRLREAFGFSIETAGVIASAAFGGFLLALVLSGWLTNRLGPRVPLVLGGGCAAAGLGLAAAAPNAAALAAGVALAASSAGFSWVPYNTAAGRAVARHLHGRVLSIISTGTTFGVAAAAVLAWAVVGQGWSWRAAWVMFAVFGLGAAVVNAWSLRGLGGGEASSSGVRRQRSLLERRARPLFAAAFSFGVTSSVYLSFAVDHVVHSGGLPGAPPEAAGPVLFAAFGIAGVVGLFTGEVEHRIGLAWTLRAIFLCSALSLSFIAAAPGSWAAVLVSAGLQGAFVMTVSAVLAFWSLRVFPQAPAAGFTAVLMFVAAGNMVAPVLASLAAGRIGMGPTFLAWAGLSLLTAAMGGGFARRGR